MIPRPHYPPADGPFGRDNAGSAEESQRFGSIDAVRGAAMLFVFLAHFTSVYLWKTGERELAGYLGTVGMIASPTFVIVSGMMVGFFATTNPVGFRILRIKLFDRGLFLLLAGHVLLAIAVTNASSGFAGAYRVSFITDAIAVSIMVAPWLITAIETTPRIAVAASVFFLNWLVIVQWHPAAAGLVLAKRYLVGIAGGTGAWEVVVFPIIPWFVGYLAATVLGELVGKLYANGDQKGAHQLLARIGGVSFLVAGMIDGATDGLRSAHAGLAGLGWSPTWFLAIYQKFPPGPVYLGFFGGAGIVLLAAVLEIDRRGAFPGVMNKLRQLGRASLFAFIAQYALYVGVLGRLHLSYTRSWPLFFLFSVIVLVQGAAAWDRHDGNRFFTVGLPSLLRRNGPRIRSIAAGRGEAGTFASQSARK
jgi:uncharacterized membrane protein